jgi:hypothetical protein
MVVFPAPAIAVINRVGTVRVAAALSFANAIALSLIAVSLFEEPVQAHSSNSGSATKKCFMGYS